MPKERSFIVEIGKKPGLPDPFADGLIDDIRDLGIDSVTDIRIHNIYWLNGEIDKSDAEKAAKELLTDIVVERYNIGELKEKGKFKSFLIGFLPGVTDPAGASAVRGIKELGINGIKQVKTGKRFLIAGKIKQKELELIRDKLLMNKVIQREMKDTDNPFPVTRARKVKTKVIPVRELDDKSLMVLSDKRVLSLNLDELHIVQNYFRDLKRDPTDVELETIAQTWSEHCVHKTLRSDYVVDGGVIKNLLKSTIMAATRKIKHPMCVSVFEDNAGIIKFDKHNNICFKVETHNHPSAIEPYGGAGTGIGGVIRDILGCGLGAKPIANTDIFCFALPDTSFDELPPGTLHPKRIMKGVVAGVRDYGNRMGIPTVNGSVSFHPKYVGNPLVYCGTIGIMPSWASFKEAKPGDKIFVMGGSTGRDGIHGATFSSKELDEASEVHSSGAVQIGNPITEKKFTDVMLKCRDLHLYNAVTDCGAGGFSSAVGEMGKELGAKVELCNAPLKYSGLAPWEIWVSEAQERMVFAVPPQNVDRMMRLCEAEDVQATVLGTFTGDGKLRITYEGKEVADLDMQFLHEGCPTQIKEVIVKKKEKCEYEKSARRRSHLKSLKKILSHPDIASKEWIIRQYDHEVQGQTSLKPLVGKYNDGPSDGAVLAPFRDLKKGIVIAHGINTRLGEYDPYQMAAHAIDEAVRNNVALGGNPSMMALLDNFSWGSVRDPESLGALYEACLACHDVAMAYGMPFISGKDSLNNEYAHGGRMIQIPHTLLVSSISIIDDVEKTVSMDLKKEGNPIYVMGVTKAGLAGSYLGLVTGEKYKKVPLIEPEKHIADYHALYKAISMGLVASCHDVGDGGIAAALAEMCFAADLGARIDIDRVPIMGDVGWESEILFGESTGRFLIEVLKDKESEFLKAVGGEHAVKIGEVQQYSHLSIEYKRSTLISEGSWELRTIWQKPLGW